MDPAELFGKLRPLCLDSFGELFNTMKASAFRLEALEYFSIPEEVEEISLYRGGQKAPPIGSNQDWLDTVSKATQRGVDFRRVRLVKEPVHDYLKYEIAWGYRLNVPAGEKVSCIMYSTEPVFETQVPIFKDFWLFDDEHCFLMEYDLLGRFLGVNAVPEEFTAPYIALKREALDKATDITKTPLWKFAA
jgi:hypothetical protein